MDRGHASGQRQSGEIQSDTDVALARALHGSAADLRPEDDTIVLLADRWTLSNPDKKRV